MKQKQTSVCQGEGGNKGGKKWELGISRGKLLYIGWIKKQSPTV